jgi:hypothetical protein
LHTGGTASAGAVVIVRVAGILEDVCAKENHSGNEKNANGKSRNANFVPLAFSVEYGLATIHPKRTILKHTLLPPQLIWSIIS